MSSSRCMCPRCKDIPPQMLYIRTQLEVLCFTYDFGASILIPWAFVLCLPGSRIVVTGQVGFLFLSHSLAQHFPCMAKLVQVDVTRFTLTALLTARLSGDLWAIPKVGTSPRSRRCLRLATPPHQGQGDVKIPHQRHKRYHRKSQPRLAMLASLDLAGLWCAQAVAWQRAK